MQFLQNDKGGAERIPAFMLVPRLKINKDFERLVYLNFSVKLKADVANLCDEKIRRAFEDCEFLDRKIDSVRLKCEIENTDIDFYELPDSKNPSFQLKHVIVKGLMCERQDGTTYLYFGCEAALSKTLGLGKWAVERFGSEMFAEFRPSQGALAFPMVGGIVDAPAPEQGELVGAAKAKGRKS